MRYESMLVYATLILLSLDSGASAQSDSAKSDSAKSESEVTWDQVRPVFQKRCFACHRGEQARGGLDLSTVAGIKAGSVSGAAVVSGKPEDSMIYTLAAHLENPQMPPNSAKTPQRELDLIFGWIRDGLSERIAAPSPENSGQTRSNLAARRRPAMAIPTATKPVVPIVMKPRSFSADTSRRLPTILRTITAVASSPTGPLVAVAEQDGILIWKWDDQTLIRQIAFEGEVHCLKFSRDGRTLIAGGGVGGTLGRVAGFDPETGEQQFVVGQESDVVLSADISPDGRLVALGGPSRLVRVFDSTNGAQVYEIQKHTDWILNVAFSQDGLLLATADRFGGLYTWEATSGKPFMTHRGHSGPVNGLLWSSTSNTLTSVSDDATIRLWDMHKGTSSQPVRLNIGGVLTADCDATGLIVFGGRSNRVSFCSHNAELPVIRTIDLEDEVTAVALTQDGTHLVTADAVGHVRLFRAQDGSQAGELTLPVP